MSTVDAVQKAVLTEMLRGRLAPGSWLRQDEWAARLGVSKIPVREAMHRLAAHGLLRFESNRGVMIPTLNASDADEIFQLRRSIEPALLRRAVPRQTIVDHAEAEAALRDEGESMTASNWDFHAALYRPAGWFKGLAIVETLHAAVAPYVALYVEVLGGRTHSEREHRAILRACRAGDATRACEVLRVHLDGAADALGAVLSIAEDGDGTPSSDA